MTTCDYFFLLVVSIQGLVFIGIQHDVFVLLIYFEVGRPNLFVYSILADCVK